MKKFPAVAALVAAFNALAREEGATPIKMKTHAGIVSLRQGLRILYEGIIRSGNKWAISAQTDRLESCLIEAGRRTFNDFDQRILAALGE